MTRSALLLLADSRFPAGAHARSGGLEAAAAAGRVRDPGSLHEFLLGRLHTGALLCAAFAAASCQTDHVDDVAELDHEYGIRLMAPVSREDSRSQGAHLLRAARATWPGPRLEPLAALAEPPHHPLVLGAACASAGLSAEDAACCAVHVTLGAPAQAAVRLLGLDPLEVAGVLARLTPAADRVAARALTLARMALLRGDLSLLPSLGSPLLDLGMPDHATWEVRHFAD